MTRKPKTLIDPPDDGDSTGVDLLSEVLSHVRLSGAVFLRGEYAAPWAFDSPESHGLIQVLAPGAERLILFHIIREGHAWISAGGERIDVEAGDVVVLPYADRHLMGSHGCDNAVPLASLLPAGPLDGIPVCRVEGGGESTAIVCGYLKCEDLLFNSLLRRLPPIFRVRPRPGPAAEWMRACVTYALDQSASERPGSGALLKRLPELLFVEALRLYAELLPMDTHGWLAAMNDAIVRRALSALHSRPAQKWSVSGLAACTATSRSVLDERFRHLLGQSPMRYLAEWRMQLAASWLRETELKIAAIAERLGYESEEAFSRAFRRLVGRPPAQWRERATTSAPARRRLRKGSLAQMIVGSWKRRSRYDIDAAGLRTDEKPGQGAIGLVIFDRAGNFSAQFMKRDRFDALRPAGGSASDANAAGPKRVNNVSDIDGYQAYFGTYVADEETSCVALTLTGSLSRENVGHVMKRTMKVEGDQLTISVDTTADDGSPVTLTITFDRVA
jgi:AraC-like DNA-binding protein